MCRAVNGVRLFQGRQSAQPALDPTAQTARDLADDDAVEADGGVDQTETPMKVAQGTADVEKAVAEMLARLCIKSVVTSYLPEYLHGEAKRFEDQADPRLIPGRSEEHVCDAHHMRATSAALLQCEYLPD